MGKSLITLEIFDSIQVLPQRQGAVASLEEGVVAFGRVDTPTVCLARQIQRQFGNRVRIGRRAIVARKSVDTSPTTNVVTAFLFENSFFLVIMLEKLSDYRCRIDNCFYNSQDGLAVFDGPGHIRWISMMKT